MRYPYSLTYRLVKNAIFANPTCIWYLLLFVDDTITNDGDLAYSDC